MERHIYPASDAFHGVVTKPRQSCFCSGAWKLFVIFMQMCWMVVCQTRSLRKLLDKGGGVMSHGCGGMELVMPLALIPLVVKGITS